MAHWSGFIHGAHLLCSLDELIHTEFVSLFLWHPHKLETEWSFPMWHFSMLVPTLATIPKNIHHIEQAIITIPRTACSCALRNCRTVPTPLTVQFGAAKHTNEVLLVLVHFVKGSTTLPATGNEPKDLEKIELLTSHVFTEARILALEMAWMKARAFTADNNGIAAVLLIPIDATLLTGKS